MFDFEDRKIGDRKVMVGRKRKPGKRKPSGDLVQDKEPTSPEAIARTRLAIASGMPHRKSLPAHQRASQDAECPIGSLSLIGAITGPQYDAAKEFRRRVRRYRVLIESPKADPSAIPMGGTPGGRVTFLISDEDAGIRRDQYNRAFEALEHRERIVINSVVVHDKPLQPGDLPALRRGLDRLAQVFGLTQTRKSGRGGK